MRARQEETFINFKEALSMFYCPQFINCFDKKLKAVILKIFAIFSILGVVTLNICCQNNLNFSTILQHQVNNMTHCGHIINTV